MNDGIIEKLARDIFYSNRFALLPWILLSENLKEAYRAEAYVHYRKYAVKKILSEVELTREQRVYH